MASTSGFPRWLHDISICFSFGQELKIIHFIGAAKPWLQQYNWESRSVDAPGHLRELLQLWWDLFVGQVHSQLDTAMVSPRKNNLGQT